MCEWSAGRDRAGQQAARLSLPCTVGRQQQHQHSHTQRPRHHQADSTAPATTDNTNGTTTSTNTTTTPNTNGNNSKAASKDYRWYGLDLEEGRVRDNVAAGVLEPAMSKIKMIRFATEAAITILRIDDAIKMNPAEKPDRPVHDDY